MSAKNETPDLEQAGRRYRREETVGTISIANPWVPVPSTNPPELKHCHNPSIHVVVFSPDDDETLPVFIEIEDDEGSPHYLDLSSPKDFRKALTALGKVGVNTADAQSLRDAVQALRTGTSVLDVDPLLDRKKRRVQGIPPNISDGQSATGRQLAVLQRKYHEYLLSDDPDVLPIVLGAVAAHRLDGEPTWLLNVGPPSGAKTDILSLLNDVEGVWPISDLTDKTLASGFKPGTSSDPSLLAQLDEAILVFKDFTTVLEMDRTRRAQVLAQLREVYDGRFDKAWGNGKVFHWKGRVSVLAGVTLVIDQHYAVMNVLGQRFMLLRPRQPDRQDAGERAVDNCSDEGKQTHSDLARHVEVFLAGLPEQSPDVSREVKRSIVHLADLTTRARSAVKRGGYKHEIDYVPEPEMPGRFARQLVSLGRGIALVSGHSEITAPDLLKVRRVAADSIPTARRKILKALVEADEALSVPRLAQLGKFSDSFASRALEDLEMLDLVRKERLGLWSLCDDWSEFFN